MYKIKKLPGSVRLIYEHIPYAKSVSAGIFIKSGSVHETAETHGISHFIEHMLFKGTSTYSALDIATISERTGGRLNAYTDRECTCIYTRVLPEDLDISLELMTDMLLNSVFDDDAITTEKNVVLEEIKMYEDNPEELVHDMLAEITYPSHPIGKPIVGTADSVSAFTRDTIKNYINSRYIGNNIVVSVTGNFSEPSLIEKVTKLFENTASSTVCESTIPATFTCGKKEIRKQVEQTHIALAFEGYPSLDDRKYSLSLVNNIFGGSTNSRLFQKIREDLGLVYSVYSCPNAYTSASYTSVYAGCGTENLKLVHELLLEEAYNISKNGITAEELELTKKQFACSFVLSSESIGSLMSSYGRQLLILDRIKTDEEILNKIQSVDLDAANCAAAMLNPEKVSTALITP